jgi:hypothetical protein
MTLDLRAHHAFVPSASLPVVARYCENLFLPKPLVCRTKQTETFLKLPCFPSQGVRARPVCSLFRHCLILSLRCEFISGAVRVRWTSKDTHMLQRSSPVSSCSSSTNGTSDPIPETADNSAVKIELTPSLQHEVAEVSLPFSGSGDSSGGSGRKDGDGGDGSSASDGSS